MYIYYDNVCLWDATDNNVYLALETRMPKMVGVTKSKRFEGIKRNIPFNNNLKPDTEKLHQIRPLFSENCECMSIASYGMDDDDFSIDRQIVLFKGRFSLNQYNSMKP